MTTKRTARAFEDETGSRLDMRERPAALSQTPAATTANSIESSGDSIKTATTEQEIAWTSASSASSRVSLASIASSPPDAMLSIPTPNLLPTGTVLSEPVVDAMTLVPGGPPINFGTILPGLYRSSYPKPENFDFLKTLHLKAIVTLVDKNFTEEYGQFMKENNIRHHTISMKGTKKEDIPLATMQAIMNLVLDRRNHPMLIHCNQGRHRTGCVAAVVRIVSGWDKETATAEYRVYAGRKLRECDVRYIRTFNLASMGSVLANPDLDIRDLRDKAKDACANIPIDPLITANAAAHRTRVPSFVRATLFSMTLLFIWMLSGLKLASIRR